MNNPYASACHGKRQMTAQQAHKLVSRMRFKGRAYRCQYCATYHIGGTR